MGLATPTPMAAGAMTPEQMQSWRWEKELDERNRPLSDEELDALFPQEGYKVRMCVCVSACVCVALVEWLYCTLIAIL